MSHRRETFEMKALEGLGDEWMVEIPFKSHSFPRPPCLPRPCGDRVWSSVDGW